MTRKNRKNKSNKAASKKKAVVEDKKDLKLLEGGYVPKQTKIGTEFKGKNKIIVS